MVGKGDAPLDKLVQCNAKGVHVGGVVDALALGHLGRNVNGGSAHLGALQHVPVGHEAREAEIADLDRLGAVVKQQIGRFKVT